MKKLLVTLAIFLSSNVVRGQVMWDIQTSLTTAQSFSYKLYVTPSGSTAISQAEVLTGVVCSGTADSLTQACQAPITQATAIGATMPGAKSELTAIDSGGGFAESSKSIPFIMGSGQSCLPTSVQINVGTWTKDMPVGGVGQVLFNLRQSINSVIKIVTMFNGVVQDTTTGDRLNNVAGTYFVTNVPAGSYQLTVQVYDAMGCTDGGPTRPMTVTVQ